MLPFVIKTFVLSIFEWELKTGFTVYCILYEFQKKNNPMLCLLYLVIWSCLWVVFPAFPVQDIFSHRDQSLKVTPFKAALSVTFDLLILELMYLFFKNTVKKLKFKYTFYQFRKS